MGCKGSRVQISALRPIKSSTSEARSNGKNARGTPWGTLGSRKQLEQLSAMRTRSVTCAVWIAPMETLHQRESRRLQRRVAEAHRERESRSWINLAALKAARVVRHIAAVAQPCRVGLILSSRHTSLTRRNCSASRTVSPFARSSRARARDSRNAVAPDAFGNIA
jgi:hypothetical protein